MESEAPDPETAQLDPSNHQEDESMWEKDEAAELERLYPWLGNFDGESPSLPDADLGDGKPEEQLELARNGKEKAERPGIVRRPSSTPFVEEVENVAESCPASKAGDSDGARLQPKPPPDDPSEPGASPTLQRTDQQVHDVKRGDVSDQGQETETGGSHQDPGQDDTQEEDSNSPPRNIDQDQDEIRRADDGGDEERGRKLNKNQDQDEIRRPGDGGEEERGRNPVNEMVGVRPAERERPDRDSISNQL
ncbi:hypothetical protein ACJ41O_000507 [Fusarium nematophilum]